MKKLLILSGKGGTGKTTIASSFIHLSGVKQFADCDVEAPNLHLMYKQGVKESKPYYGLAKAIINQSKCIDCGLCYDHCRFNAVMNTEGYQIDLYKCEGCGVCEFVCPVDAIEFKQTEDGYINLYKNEVIFSTGELKMGSGNSGLLVTKVKKQLTEDTLTIIDGPPGIGCPVIASLSGVDYVLVVTEPSLSGFSDLKRMIKTIEKAKINFGVCINKFDINLEISDQITTYLKEKNMTYFGHINYSKDVSKIINQGKVIVSEDSSVSRQIKSIYDKVVSYI